MNSSEFEKELFPVEPALSPSIVIERFNRCLEIYGKDMVFRDRRFKKAREMWIGACFLLALSKAKAVTYWLMPEYGETPDLWAKYFIPHPSILDSDREVRLCVEVTEWEEHSTLSLTDQILKKIDGKCYPGYTALVVYVKRIGEHIDLEAIFNQLNSRQIKIMEVWLVASNLGPDGKDHALIGLYPAERVRVDFSLKAEYEHVMNTQLGMLQVVRQKGRDFSTPEVRTFIFPQLS